MRIAFILSSLDRSGGVSLIIEYANRLVAHGHQVFLVAPQRPSHPAMAALLSPAVQVVQTREAIPDNRSVFSLLKLVIALAQMVPPVDCVIATHTPTTLPTLLVSGWFQRGIRRYWLYMDYPEMFAARPIEKYLLQCMPVWFHGIAAISQPYAEMLARQVKIPVVMSGSGLRRPDLFFPAPQPRNGLLRHILFVGDNRPRKGLGDFLQAAEIIIARCPDVRFWIVSKMPCTIPSSLPHDFFLAPDDESLAALYQQSDIFVFASWGEGLGLPPLEAMASGLPVVVADSQGVRDYAKHNFNALVVPPKKPEELAAAIILLLQNPEKAAFLAANGLETVKKYDWDAAVGRFEELICQV